MRKRNLRVSLKNWESKVLRGQYIRSVDRQLIGGDDTLLWLWKVDQKEETRREILAAQDEAFQTKYHSTKILQTVTESKCRM